MNLKSIRLHFLVTRDLLCSVLICFQRYNNLQLPYCVQLFSACMYISLNPLFKVDTLYPQARCYRCSIHSPHCMCPISFLMPADASFIACTRCCRVSGLPLWYALDFRQTHRKKYIGDKSGNRSGCSTVAPLPDHLRS
jgi:hypothetical protein